MIFFVTVLRALAACLITNSHYTGIYPTDLIANGGLAGDVIFFAVSGYCLANIKQNFFGWYRRRIVRIYIPVALITLVYLILGFYHGRSFIEYFIYPTEYHFVASIVLLYIPYYLIAGCEKLNKRLPQVMAGIAVLYLLLYLFAYDKGYYHIDAVREPFIRFLFMESMLLGLWFRQNDNQYRNRFRFVTAVATVLCFGVYCVSKMLFARNLIPATFQILNQGVLFLFLYLLFRTFAGLDHKLECMKKPIKRVVVFVSEITLEIYIVQNVLISLVRPLGYFPLNWLLLTGAILLCATLLHKVSSLLIQLENRCFDKVCNMCKGAGK